MGDTRGAYIFFVGRPEVKRSLARPRRRWDINIKINFKETGWDEWTGLIWQRKGTGGGLF
jgi:hypothetical protein